MKEKNNPATTFEFRPGATAQLGLHPGWAGMMPDLDPGSLPFNNLAAGLNVRFEGGQVRNRWGFKKLKQVPMPWDDSNYDWSGRLVHPSIEVLGQHHMQHNVPVLWMSAHNPGTASYTGDLSVQWFNPDVNPVLGQVGDTIVSSDVQGAIGNFAGGVYSACGGHLYKLRTGVSTIDTTGGYTAQGIVWEGGATMIGGGVQGECLQEMGGKLYIGAYHYYDGVSLVETGATASVSNMCMWRDTHLVGTTGWNYSDWFYMDSDGTWSGVQTLPGPVNNQYLNAMVEYRDAIYVASGYQDVYRLVPGSAATTAHTMAGGYVYALCVMNDVMYFLRSVEDGGVWTTYLGLYDADAPAGSEWKEDIKVLNTDLYPFIGPGTALIAYRNRLVASNGFYVSTHERSYDPMTKWYTFASCTNNQYINGFRVGY